MLPTEVHEFLIYRTNLLLGLGAASLGGFGGLGRGLGVSLLRLYDGWVGKNGKDKDETMLRLDD